MKVCGLTFEKDVTCEHPVYVKHFKSQYEDFHITIEKNFDRTYYMYVRSDEGYDEHDALPEVWELCKSPQGAIKRLKFEVEQKTKETLIYLKRLEELATLLNTKEN
jgi:hypothetical protein